MKKIIIFTLFLLCLTSIFALEVKDFEQGFSPDSLYYNTGLKQYKGNEINFPLTESKILFVSSPYCWGGIQRAWSSPFTKVLAKYKSQFVFVAANYYLKDTVLDIRKQNIEGKTIWLEKDGITMEKINKLCPETLNAYVVVIDKNGKVKFVHGLGQGSYYKGEYYINLAPKIIKALSN